MRSEKPETVAFYTRLLVRLIRDTANLLGLRVSSFDRDICSLEKRVNVQGLVHLTVDLPLLAKELDRSLATDTPYRTPPGFKARPYGNLELPVFLRTLWLCVYAQDGQIKETDLQGTDRRLFSHLSRSRDLSGSRMQVTAVRAIRQICYLVYKLELPYESSCLVDKYQQFIDVDASLPKVDDEILVSPRTKRALENASVLVAWALKKLNPYDIVPKHGPGSVATGEVGPEKFCFSRYYPELDEVYGYTEHFFFNYNHLCYGLKSLEKLEYRAMKIASVVPVPKDSRGPRLISMEPLEVQWIQQGLARNMVQAIESSELTHRFIRFTDQTMNRTLACRASLDDDGGGESFVTIDLKDASDRVSDWLVKTLYPGELYKALKACRSNLTHLPDGRYVHLNKFAPMGSACCFPVEALVFWALAVGSLVDTITRGSIKSIPPVYVYGDDIICRRADFSVFAPVFEELHLVFNKDKCCVGSHFRESCGLDAFKGNDVTPVKMHTPVPKKEFKKSPEALLSFIAYANALRRGDRMYYSTADAIEQYILEQFGPLPVVNDTCDYSFAFVRSNCSREATLESLKPFKTRWNESYCRQEWRLWGATPRTSKCVLTPGWANLWSLLDLDSDVFGFSRTRLEAGAYTIPHIVKLRPTWIADCQLFS